MFASDEFYALTGMSIPSYEEYEGFPQLENGVGLVKSFEYEIERELEKIITPKRVNKTYILATGTLAYDFMVDISNKIMRKFNGLELKVVPIVNNFFGDTITVSGLVTGFDLITQIKKQDLDYDGIIIPRTMLKRDEEIFLDNLTLEEVSKELGVEIITSPVDGKDLIDILKIEVDK